MRYAVSLAICFLLAGMVRADDVLPNGPGKELVEKRCGSCHSPQIVAGEDETRDQWNDTLNQMMGMGAPLTEDEFNQILDYLANSFPPKVRINRATAERIADGLDLTDKQAQAIVQYRQQHGNFKSFEDLLRVPGLDAKVMADKKKFIAF
jgi:competence protein ComEA